MNSIETHLPELTELEQVIKSLGSAARVTVLTQVTAKGETLPVYGLELGNPDPKAPVLGLFGGVHGLERIGTRVVVSYLRMLAELLRWDEMTMGLLGRIRIISIPLINPAGMYLKSRSNGNGVDLMRNAPVEAMELPSKWGIFRGHRLSSRLPWFRGAEGAGMESESQAVVDFVKGHLFESQAALTLDVHSGYGAVDRLWFPYARALEPIPNLAEMYRLKQLLDRTCVNHIYRVEPQSKQYRTHGDLWDFLYDEYRVKEGAGVYLPLSLEMGSWLWVKKNPRQMFSALGAFNPLQRHRYQRILRRHVALLDFLGKAALSSKTWASLNEEESREAVNAARPLWYEK